MIHSILVLAATAAVTFAQNNTGAIMKQVILKQNPQYTLNYNIINETSAIPTLNVTLSIQGYDTSKWTSADGKTGFYLGLGFGRSEMKNVDAINCLYFWTNKTTDVFQCYDMWFDGNRQPVSTPEAQDAKNVRTTGVKVPAGEFTVSYQRAFKTGDPANLDYVLSLNDTTDFIWSFGPIRVGQAQEHQDPDSGNIKLNFLTGELISFAKYLQGAFIGSFVVISALLI